MAVGKKIADIQLIAASLCLLYGVSFLSFLSGLLVFTQFYSYSMGVLILFASLFISATAVVMLEEWGRKLLVVLNTIMGFYLIALFVECRGFISPSYIFLAIVVALFFNQPLVKVYFKGDDRFVRKSILVVDDDESVIKLVTRILLSKGYSVLSATTGEQGLQIAKTQKPDLIILDVIMPGIKGREVCVELKADENVKDIPVIFLTSKNSPDDVAAEMAVGAVAHLNKPVDSRQLVSEIKRVLKRK